MNFKKKITSSYTRNRKFYSKIKSKDIAVQTDFCNPIHILIDQIRTFCRNASVEKENVENKLEMLQNQNKELNLMFKLFQMRHSYDEPIVDFGDIENRLADVSDAEEKELLCTKFSLLKEYKKTKDEYCDSVLQLKSMGVGPNFKVKLLILLNAYLILKRKLSLKNLIKLIKD